MKITSASSGSSASNIINNLVDKIYNLFFGYLDSLFDDDNYEKKEETIPTTAIEAAIRITMARRNVGG